MRLGGDDEDEEEEGMAVGIDNSSPPMSAAGGAGRIPHMTLTSAPSTIEFNMAALDLSNMRGFLTNPVPRRAGVVQCYIRRYRSIMSSTPEYRLFMKEGDRFLLYSKNKSYNKKSNYFVSMADGDFDKTSPAYLGKVRSSFMGTEFQMFDHGMSPKDTPPSTPSSQLRKEVAVAFYAPNMLGSRGPRRMQVFLPLADENDVSVTWREGRLLEYSRGRNHADAIHLINKPPRWNEQVGAYVLNFNGRVTMASVKNFQLVEPENQNAVILQFGRVGKDEFTMDMQWPITPLQAFQVTLSSFHSKIACD